MRFPTLFARLAELTARSLGGGFAGSWLSCLHRRPANDQVAQSWLLGRPEFTAQQSRRTWFRNGWKAERDGVVPDPRDPEGVRD